MSDQRQFGWKSGRLISSPLARFWQPPATLDDADPQVPSLPLLTATVAATAGIIALAFGYFEHAPEADLDSYVGTVIEQPSAPATHEAVVYYVVGEGIEPEDVEPSVYEPLPLAEYITPAAAEADAALGVDFPDLDDDEPLPEAFIGGTFTSPAAATNEAEVAAVVTDPWEAEPPEESVTPYFFDEVTPPLLVEFPGAEDDEPPADAVIAYLIEDTSSGDLTQIPGPVLTDPADPDELDDAVIAFLFEDAPIVELDAALGIEFPDEEEPAQDIEAYIAGVFEDAAAPDLTFVPGWQDDFLRAYEQQREDDEEALLAGLVFDPFGQVDDPPPVIPGVGEYIIRARRRHRR